MTRPQDDPTNVLRISRCAVHPKASIIFTRDGKYLCIMCGRSLQTEMVEPPQEILNGAR